MPSPLKSPATTALGAVPTVKRATRIRQQRASRFRQAHCKASCHRCSRAITGVARLACRDRACSRAQKHDQIVRIPANRRSSRRKSHRQERTGLGGYRERRDSKDLIGNRVEGYCLRCLTDREILRHRRGCRVSYVTGLAGRDRASAHGENRDRGHIDRADRKRCGCETHREVRTRRSADPERCDAHGHIAQRPERDGLRSLSDRRHIRGNVIGCIDFPAARYRGGVC